VHSNPVSIPNTQRQRLVTRSGNVLERAYVFLPPQTWEALASLCEVMGRSGSQVIESLIETASRGKLKDHNNDATITCSE
jgi:hypothetical protein